MTSNSAASHEGSTEIRSERKNGDSLCQIDLSSSELLELLGDSYTREVLMALINGAQSANDIIQETDVSKVTAYRRLNRLEELGLLTSEVVLDPDGHHYARYRVCCAEISVRLDEEGIDSSMRVSVQQNTPAPGIQKALASD